MTESQTLQKAQVGRKIGTGADRAEECPPPQAGQTEETEANSQSGKQRLWVQTLQSPGDLFSFYQLHKEGRHSSPFLAKEMSTFKGLSMAGYGHVAASPSKGPLSEELVTTHHVSETKAIW